MNTQSQIEDLWPPDVAEQTTVTPLAILREQAALLGKKTGNLVEGRVHTTYGRPRNEESRIYHSFMLEVPALDNYSYELFRVSHPITLYPVEVRADSTTADVDARDLDVEVENGRAVLKRRLNNEEELKNWLREVFAAPHTKRILGLLMAQAAA